MKKIKFCVTETAVTVTDKPDKLPSGNINTILCEFDVSESYNGLLLRACFNGVYADIVEGVCYAPYLKPGLNEVGVYGYVLENGKYVKTMSPIPTKIYISLGSFDVNQVPNESISATELENATNLIMELVEAGKLKGDKGPQGDVGPQGPIGETPSLDDVVKQVKVNGRTYLPIENIVDLGIVGVDKWETIFENIVLTDISEIDLLSYFTKKYKKLILTFEGNGTSTSFGLADYLCLNDEINTETGYSIHTKDVRGDFIISQSNNRIGMLSLGYKSNSPQKTTIIISCEGGICKTEWLKNTQNEMDINSINVTPCIGISPYDYINNIFIGIDELATFTGTMTMRGVVYD